MNGGLLCSGKENDVGSYGGDTRGETFSGTMDELPTYTRGVTFPGTMDEPPTYTRGVTFSGTMDGLPTYTRGITFSGTMDGLPTYSRGIKTGTDFAADTRGVKTGTDFMADTRGIKTGTDFMADTRGVTFPDTMEELPTYTRGVKNGLQCFPLPPLLSCRSWQGSFFPISHLTIAGKTL